MCVIQSKVDVFERLKSIKFCFYPPTPDYSLYSWVHVCWSEHSDLSFVYGFMSLDYGFGTMTATTYYTTIKRYEAVINYF